MVGIYSSGYLVTLSPLTPLHVGVGRAGGGVDLPVQRDPLGYPVIYASSLKGALKNQAYYNDREGYRRLFGPEPGDDEKYASPVAVTDARLLFMPLRSAKASPVMVTSPFMIRSALEILDLLDAVNGAGTGQNLRDLREFLEALLDAPQPQPGQVRLLSGDPVVQVQGDSQGERRLAFIGGERFEVIEAKLERPIELGLQLPAAFKERVPRGVAVASDQDAVRLLERGMIRMTRVRLDRSRKVVEKNALWTEEYLPRGCLFVSAALLSDERYRGAGGEERGDGGLEGRLKTALGLDNNMTGYLVLGGKESVGKGIVKISFSR